MAAFDIDAVVVGAGAVGLAIGRALARSGRETLVVDQADRIGSETSARNSEVIHAGIYYPPGSQKARLCVAGKRLLYEFLESYGVPHARCGKLIVATEAGELDALTRIAERAQAAGVRDLQPLGASACRALEGEVRGVAGLLSPSTGILDSHQFMLALQGDLERHGGSLALRTQLVQAVALASGGFELTLKAEGPTSLRTRLLVNAAGLHARAVLRLLLSDDDERLPQQYYAVGHYYSYSGKAPFQRLVYPVPAKGGLGVHATLDLAGQVRFGPDVRWIDDVDYRFDDSQRAAFIDAIQRYYPGFDSRRLQPGYTGIRPKVVGPQDADGDFLLLGRAQHGLPGLVSLHGIESPGLTASLAIAEVVVAALPK